MLTEKQTDSFHWKERLDKLDHLPGQAMDKDQAWEKLHMRLQPAAPRRKAAWYWAAACLLLAFLLYYSMFNFQQDRNNIAQIHKKEVPPASQSVGSKKPSLAVPATYSILRHEQTINTRKSMVIPALQKKTAPANSPALPLIIEDKARVVFTDYSAVPPSRPLIADTATMRITITAIKKSLPLVHINELEPGISNTERLALSADQEKRTFTFSLGTHSATARPVYSNGIQIQLDN